MNLRRSLGTIALLICHFAAPGAARASNMCPWINDATASGILGGAAVGAFAPGTGAEPARCSFIYKAGHGELSLAIRVTVSEQPQASLLSGMSSDCRGSDEALPAIGNQAFLCSAGHGSGMAAERILGRVRDQVFSITLSSSGDSVLDIEDLKSRVSTAAEQVSGNLF